MSENCHNCGRLCWSTLSSALTYKVYHGTYRWYLDELKARHFARTFIKTVADFAATMNQEPTPELDPRTWCHFGWRNSSGAQMAYFDALFDTYITLNLLVMNSPRLNQTTQLRARWAHRVCAGWGDLHQDDFMHDECAVVKHALFGLHEDQLVLDAHTVSLTKEYLKKVFVCLIRLFEADAKKDPWFFTEAAVIDKLLWIFSASLVTHKRAPEPPRKSRKQLSKQARKSHWIKSETSFGLTQQMTTTPE